MLRLLQREIVLCADGVFKDNGVFRVLGFGFLGNCSQRYPTSHFPVVVRRSRSPLLARPYRLHPCNRTSCIHAVVGSGSCFALPPASMQSYEVDPMLCPHCGETMRIMAIIEDPPVIEKILTHHRL